MLPCNATFPHIECIQTEFAIEYPVEASLADLDSQYSPLRDLPNLFISVNVLLKEYLKLGLVIGQLLRADRDNIVVSVTPRRANRCQLWVRLEAAKVARQQGIEAFQINFVKSKE